MNHDFESDDDKDLRESMQVEDSDAEVLESKTSAGSDDVFGKKEPKGNMNGQTLRYKTNRTCYTWDFDRIETMLRSGMSGAEVASALGVSKVTLVEAVKRHFDRSFGDVSAGFRAETSKLLRIKQIQAAIGRTYIKAEREYKYVVDPETGKQKRTITKTTETTVNIEPNPIMLIWLGKNFLGQSDSPQQGGTFGSVPNYRMVGDGDDDDMGQEEVDELSDRAFGTDTDGEDYDPVYLPGLRPEGDIENTENEPTDE